MLGTGCNTSKNPARHGHKGNAKNWQVQYRDNAAERAEKTEFGCTNVDRWEISPNLRLTQADRMIDRLEVMQCEYKLINLNLVK
jgi:hypothetical protein